MNTRMMFARGIAGAAMAVMALMPGEALAFLGLFESKPTQAEMERLDALFNGYYKAPDVEAAISVLPSVKKMNKAKPDGITSMIGFYFGAAKSSVEAHRPEWEAAKKRGGKEVAVGIGAALEGKSIDDMVPRDLADYTPKILDFLWGYFLATGDAEVPHRVIRRGGMEVANCASVVFFTGTVAQRSSVSLAKDHPAVAAELEAFALNADEKSVRIFFGPALNDDARAVLSSAAVARIVSCGVAERKELTEDELREAFLKANEGVPSAREVALVREVPRRFALRPFAAKGDAWREKSVVPGNKELLLQEKRDSLGNICTLRLNFREKSHWKLDILIAVLPIKAQPKPRNRNECAKDVCAGGRGSGFCFARRRRGGWLDRIYKIYRIKKGMGA